MDIGQRLKGARSASGLTQEYVAEKLGVSRQTIYNWENNKFYPDIMSVIALSDLYSVSLDVLLKEDKKMIEHLEESTNIVKSNRRLRQTIMAVIYLLLWGMNIILSWSAEIMLRNTMLMTWSEEISWRFDASSALYYASIIISVLLTALSGLITFITAKDVNSRKLMWLLIPLFGAVTALGCFLAYDLCSLVLYNKTALKASEYIYSTVSGLLCAAGGVGIAISSEYEKERKRKKAEMKAM